MKALIYAAGLGTRLAPITDTMPKALVEVGGKPAIEHVLDKLVEAGIDDVIVNVHHFSDQIVTYLKSRNNNGLNIMISDESDLLLDTGGGLVKVIDDFDVNEPILLHNADILTNFSLTSMIDHFAETNPDALLLAWDRDSSRRLLFDETGRMSGWKNMTTGEVRPHLLRDSGLIPMAFGGVHIVGPSMFESLRCYRRENGDVFSITPFYIQNCDRYFIKSYSPAEKFEWWDIGRIETLEAARKQFM